MKKRQAKWKTYAVSLRTMQLQATSERDAAERLLDWIRTGDAPPWIMDVRERGVSGARLVTISAK